MEKPVVGIIMGSKSDLPTMKVIIAGAGGAAHLAGTIAAHTHLPVIGVPMESKYLKGIDSLFSTVQMPAGVPVATMAIGSSGAKIGFKSKERLICDYNKKELKYCLK